MAAITQSATASLGLLLPVPGATPGLGVASPGESWLELLNAAMLIIDGHDHSTGKGLPVASAAFSINSPLSFNGYDATAMRTVRFTDTATLVAADLGCIYRNGADLYYRDTAGNEVRITSGGAVNVGATGSITGMDASSAVTYVPGTLSYLFQADATTYANLRAGSVFIRRAVSGVTSEVELRSPTLSPGSYAIIFPTALPISQRLLTLDAAGNLANISFSSTVQLSGGAISVAPSSIENSHLAVNSVSGDRIQNGVVTRAKQAAVGQQVSGSCGAFSMSSTTPAAVTGLSVSLTTVGRPVIVRIQPDGTTSADGGMRIRLPTGASTPGDFSPIGNMYAQFRLLRDGVEMSRLTLNAFGVFDTLNTAWSSDSAADYAADFTFMDAPTAGAHTYTVQAVVSTLANGGVGYAVANRLVLTAYEL